MTTDVTPKTGSTKTVTVHVNNDNTLGLLVVTTLFIGYIIYTNRRLRKLQRG